jgi:CBS domain-containing protein
MTVEALLRSKGWVVHTTPPTTTVAAVVRELTVSDIGALVVSSDGERVEGIVSEREVTRGVARFGPAVLGMAVGDLISRHVPVCSPKDTITHVMKEMTLTRRRHLPVVDDGKLCGIVSLGDVVKNRLEELEFEVAVLRDAYLARR